MRAVFLAAILMACSGAPTKPVASVVHAPAPAATTVQAPPAPAPPVDPDAVPMPTWSQLRVGTLPNGLTYYVLPNAKPARRARFWLAVNAGSIQEDDDQRGVAHLVEHMAFNGTKHFPKNDLVAYLERIGMRFGADVNAVTGFDRTIYKLEVPLEDAAFADKALEVLRDWAGDITFDPAELGAPGTATKERGVVLEEWRSKRGANARLADKQIGVSLEGTRYPARLPIGTPDSIQHVSRDAILRFYKDWYRPDLMAVIVVGDITDPDAIEKAIRDRFSDLAAPAAPRRHEAGGVPAPGTRISIEADPEAPATVIRIAAFAPRTPEITFGDYRRAMAQRLYARVLRDRLETLSRESASPFVFGTASIEHLFADVDTFSAHVEAKPGRADEAMRALLAEVARIERYGVTDGELERARASSLRWYDVQAERVQESTPLCEEITRLFFDREEMAGVAVEKTTAHEILPKLTGADVDAAMKPFAGATDRAVLISGVETSALPTRDRVLAALDEVGKAELTPWQDKPPPDTLMATLPAPGKIVHETKLDAVGAVVWTLSNGVRVVAKPTKLEVDSVQLLGEAAGGTALASDKDFPNARFANDVAASLGVGSLDATALRDALADKTVQVSTAIGDTHETIRGSSTAHDLETMLQLVHLTMTAPHEDPDEIAAWQQRMADEVADRLRTPEAMFGRDVVDVLYQHHLRRSTPDAAAVAAVDPKQALAFYKARFGDASGFTFVIVGSAPLDVLRPLVERYLASLPASGHPPKERDLGIRKIRGVVVKRWKHGTEPKAHVELEFHGDHAWTRQADDDMYTLGEVLRIQLRDVLREARGGVYNVSVLANLGRRPRPSRTVLVKFTCDPARVDELVKATLDAAADLRAHGPSADYIDRVRELYAHQHQKEQFLNAGWLSWLSSAFWYGDDPSLFLDTSHMLARMTPEHVQAAARVFLDPSQYFEGILLPEDAK